MQYSCLLQGPIRGQSKEPQRTRDCLFCNQVLREVQTEARIDRIEIEMRAKRRTKEGNE
jgi:hypothetical protein